MGELREDQELEALLNMFKARNGCDFSGYKRSILRRRIQKRMRSLDIDGFEHYRAYLEANPTELVPLLDAILINVSAFFRDPAVWSFVSREVIPRVLDASPAASPIRVWSAGCAAGQEPYTLAMLFAERMGIDEYCRRVKIYATDLDQDALDRALFARYDSQALESVPETLRIKYFQNEKDGFTFHAALRRTVSFGRHDLARDRPVSHVDLLFCRNTLMYFNVNAQTQILARIGAVVNEAGFLVVGHAEMPFVQQSSFAAFAVQHGVYSKAETGFTPQKSRVISPALQPARDGLRAAGGALASAQDNLSIVAERLARAQAALRQSKQELESARALLVGIMSNVAHAIWVVDPALKVQLWNDQAAEVWGLDAEVTVGRSLLELELGLPVAELAASIRACAERGEGSRQVTVDAADRDGRIFRCHVTVTGLRHDRGMQRGAIVLTNERTQLRDLWT